MFSHKGPCAGNFATDGSALQHAENDQQDRRTDAQRCIGWQTGHRQCRNRHEENRESEDTLTAKFVPEMRQHHAPNWTHQITGCENAKSLDQHQPVWHVRWKEQMPDNARKKYEDDEIIKLQRAAQCRKAKSAEILPV